MFPVAVMAGAGWLFLFVVLLIVPPRRGRTPMPDPGDVPPAVVSLLARRLERSGYGATLVDLAARGWFEVRAPAGPAGSAGPGGPALCVVPAETPDGPLTPWGCAVSVAIALGPVLYFAAAIWLGTHGMVLLAEEMTGLVVAAGIAGGLAVLARRAAFPRVAEFDGQVIRQWMVSGDSDSEDEYHVAIDDGTRDKAWDVSIGAERYRRLPPGTFVHARVNLRSRSDVTVEPVEPPAVAHPLARVAAEQVRAATNGLPDPADLVLETEAAAILGGKVRGSHLDGAPGRTMVCQPPSTGRPMLRVEVRHAADARRVPPTARPAPGVADGYLVSQGAAVTVSALTALISIHGSVHIASEASLAGLLPVVAGRLRDLARRIDFNQY
jgi:hypothetical protein